MKMSSHGCNVLAMKMQLEITELGNYKSPDDPGELIDGVRKDPRLSVTNQEAAILSELVHGLIVLEVGTGLGISTMALAKTAMSVTTVDIDTWVDRLILPDNVERLREIPNRYFHIAFVDGSHLYKNVMKDISVIKAPLFIMHDCHMQSVTKAIHDSNLKLVKSYDTLCSMGLYER